MDSLITVQIKITLLLLSFPEKLFRTPIHASPLAYLLVVRDSRWKEELWDVGGGGDNGLFLQISKLRNA